MIIKKAKGGAAVFAVFAVVVAVVLTVATGGLGAAIFGALAEPLYAGIATGVACVTGIICGSGGGGGGGGGGQTVHANDPCTSPANACGMTNSGTIINNGDGTGSCSGTTPPNSFCPAPSITSGTGFYATPSTVGPNGSATLTWSAANTTDCVVKGDNGFSGGSATDSGSASTGPLTQTTTFTLTCEDGPGGPQTSSSLRVIIDPHYQEI
jgi:hypothetical protein